MLFRADVFTWIPLPDVPNPLHSLPGGTGRWGPGACGPHFGGDDFVAPPVSHALWTTRTFRARQTLAFEVARFGDPPLITVNSGCVPGITTVLTGPRRSGGRLCHSLTATVKTSTSSVTFDASANWYSLKMHGEAQDPVPAAVAAHGVSAGAGSAASALTPNLEWELDLRFQDGSGLPFATRARYAVSAAASLDVAATTFPHLGSLGGGGRTIHGLLTLRRFPSLVLYTTVDTGGGASTVPHYFADASARSLGAIVIGQTDVLRTIPW